MFNYFALHGDFNLWSPVFEPHSQAYFSIDAIIFDTVWLIFFISLRYCYYFEMNCIVVLHHDEKKWKKDFSNVVILKNMLEEKTLKTILTVSWNKFLSSISSFPHLVKVDWLIFVVIFNQVFWWIGPHTLKESVENYYWL